MFYSCYYNITRLLTATVSWTTNLRPVHAQMRSGDINSELSANPPTTSRLLDDLMQNLKNIIVPRLTPV